MMPENSEERVGIIAGWGNFPVEVAQHLSAAGKSVYVVALKGHADSQLETLATEYRCMGVLSIGGHMRFFEKFNVSKIVLAGKLFKDKILYHGRGWIEHLPDTTCLRILGGSFVTKSRDGRDDTILNSVVDAYGRKRMRVLPITEVAPTMLATEGCLTRKKPSHAQMLDIEFGWGIASQMGGLDIGQSITVKDQIVLGVEAIEGTDALVKRTGMLCPRGGFSLIKVAKPNQDMRFDVPTIGLRTIEQLVRAGGRAIAIEANRTILVEREETLAFANKHGVAIISIEAAQASNSVTRGGSCEADPIVVGKTSAAA